MSGFSGESLLGLESAKSRESEDTGSFKNADSMSKQRTGLESLEQGNRALEELSSFHTEPRVQTGAVLNPLDSSKEDLNLDTPGFGTALDLMRGLLLLWDVAFQVFPSLYSSAMAKVRFKAGIPSTVNAHF